jgi:hypothetical protein
VATRARRGEIPADRRAGVDANVSNLSVASFLGDERGRLVADRIGCTAHAEPDPLSALGGRGNEDLR